MNINTACRVSGISRSTMTRYITEGLISAPTDCDGPDISVSELLRFISLAYNSGIHGRRITMFPPDIIRLNIENMLS